MIYAIIILASFTLLGAYLSGVYGRWEWDAFGWPSFEPCRPWLTAARASGLCLIALVLVWAGMAVGGMP